MKIEFGLDEGQVLQRLKRGGASARIMGTCEETGIISATISHRERALTGWEKKVVGKASRGKFAVVLKGIPVGGPYGLELHRRTESVVVANFFVGDVWLLAGQSNMEGVGDMTGAAKSHPLIRSFSMARTWGLASDPLHILRESPDACHNEGQPFTPTEAQRHRRTTTRGVGVGIFFAREMLKRSDVPQGLICTAHGGTTMSQWNPVLKKDGGESLYGSMLLSARATGQPVAGLLWYQGESDANETDHTRYTDRMIDLVAATRRDLHQPSLPWLAVQIGRVFDHFPNVAAWNSIQERQRALPARIRNLETVSVVDLPLDDGIHISATGYPRLGARLARVADRLVFANRKEAKPPSVREIRLNSLTKIPGALPAIDVFFDNVVGDLKAKGEPQGFTLVTAEGHVWPFCYKTTLHGHFTRLHLCRPIVEDIRLHYGHGIMPVCNITDGRDFSLPVFGPLPIIRRQALLPFVSSWRVTGVLAKPSAPLETLACPHIADFNTSVKSYSSDGLVNEHDHWRKHEGQVYFFAEMGLPEPMKLKFLMGYDGPFRLWLDGEPLFLDLNGTNPCYPDQGTKTVAMKARNYRLTVAMDINRGAAWGFMLRFLRGDVAKPQLMAGTFRRPIYSTP